MNHLEEGGLRAGMADSKSVLLPQPGITKEKTACVDGHMALAMGTRGLEDLRSGVEAGQTWSLQE